MNSIDHPRRGFTLVELLVVLTIIAVIIGLMLPAIQAGRESSRRAKCLNNQRQIILALINYEDKHQMLPPGRIRGQIDGEGLGFSAFAQILPMMEQSFMFNAINFSRNAVSDQSNANETIRKTQIQALLCPNDTVFDPSRPNDAPNNFVLNVGTGYSLIHNNGSFLENRGLRSAEFSDGLSTTALVSETLRSDKTPARMMIALAGKPIADYQTDCLPVAPNAALRGWNWIYGGPGATLYTHHRTPNAIQPDCQGGDPRPNGDKAGWDQATLSVTARSGHPNGVNVTFGDGHISFVKNPVSISVWQALGTRNGNEYRTDF